LKNKQPTQKGFVVGMSSHASAILLGCCYSNNKLKKVVKGRCGAIAVTNKLNKVVKEDRTIAATNKLKKVTKGDGAINCFDGDFGTQSQALPKERG
jgi:hypothetical protein